MIGPVEKRRLPWGDIMASAVTDCGRVTIIVPSEDVEWAGEGLDNVIGSRLENARLRRTLLPQKTDAEWLAETVNADG